MKEGEPDEVADACNPSYLGNRDQEGTGLRSALGKNHKILSENS
jgi:hypothetical protein